MKVICSHANCATKLFAGRCSRKSSVCLMIAHQYGRRQEFRVIYIPHIYQIIWDLGDTGSTIAKLSKNQHLVALGYIAVAAVPLAEWLDG